jgi:hypothetical protein
VKQTFTKHETKTTLKRKGTGKSESAKHPLAGKTIQLVREKCTLQPLSKPPETDRNELMTAGPDWLWLLPGKPVAVKDTWTIPSSWRLESIHDVFVGNDTICELEKLSGGEAWIRFRAGSRCKGRAKFSRKHGHVTHVEYESSYKRAEVTTETKVRFSQKPVPAKKS